MQTEIPRVRSAICGGEVHVGANCKPRLRLLLHCAMLRFLFVVFSLCLHALGARAVVPGAAAALRGDVQGQSEFELNLRPPEQKAENILEALDSLSKLEIEKHAAQAEIGAREKQRLFKQEKLAIYKLVEAAFEPLRANLQAK